MRRTLIIIGVVAIILGVGVAVYFIFFAAPTVTTTPGNVTLPGAGQGGNNTGGGTGGVTTTTGTPVVVTPRLVQISKGPVVPGEVVVTTKAVNASSSPATSVNFIERQSGNVFSYTPATQTLTRINNKTIPGIQSAAWLPNGSVAFVRYLSGGDFSTINTYALAATSSDGFFLAQDLADLAVSSTNIFALTSGVNGSTASLMNTNGTHAVTIFTSPLSALRISYAGENQYLAFTKPASSLAGDAYLVDSTGHFSRVGDARNGLVALASPSGKWVLISSVRGTTMQMELVNAATNEMLLLPVSTIADKCVWAADDSAIYCGIPMTPPIAAYPDDWYQGAVQFSDRIWKIQVADRYAQLVLDFSKEAKSSLDAEALAVNPANSTLVFVNKNDGSLWSYSL